MENINPHNHGTDRIHHLVLRDLGIELSKIKSGSKIKILDLGAGTGPLEPYILALLDKYGLSGEILCTDMIEHGFNISEPRVTFKVQNLDLDFNHGKFDFIIATEVIEHMKSQYNFIKNCLQNLSDTGIIYMTSPNVFSASSLAKIFLTGIPSFFAMNIDNEHISMTPQFIVQLLTDKISAELHRNAELSTQYTRNMISTPIRKNGERITIGLPGKGNRFLGEHGMYKIRGRV